MKEWDELIDKAADGENGKFFPFRMTDTVDGAAERDPLFRAAVDSAVKRFLSGDWGTSAPRIPESMRTQSAAATGRR